MLYIRRYVSSDCGALAGLFHQTVHSVNAKDYAPEQLAAWSPGTVDLSAWDASFREHVTLVAVGGGAIIGFGDIAGSGYLDRLYVHKDHQGRGIGTAICDGLERAAGPKTITAHVSITAKPFFEGRGYRVVREQRVIRRGVPLTNYVMEKQAVRDK